MKRNGDTEKKMLTQPQLTGVIFSPHRSANYQFITTADTKPIINLFLQHPSPSLAICFSPLPLLIPFLFVVAGALPASTSHTNVTVSAAPQQTKCFDRHSVDINIYFYRNLFPGDSFHNAARPLPVSMLAHGIKDFIMSPAINLNMVEWCFSLNCYAMSMDKRTKRSYKNVRYTRIRRLSRHETILPLIVIGWGFFLPINLNYIQAFSDLANLL